jgi:hypothetical protein
MKVDGLMIGDWRFGLAIDDWDCRMAIAGWHWQFAGVSQVAHPSMQSSIANKTANRKIDNQISNLSIRIVNPSLGNPSIINRQSAIGNQPWAW